MQIWHEINALISIYILILFIIGISKSDNGIMDIAWGLGFCFMALYSFAHYAQPTLRQLVITFCTFLWGIRLALHLHQRNANKPEDFRYANWRKAWGSWFIFRSFFQVYALQGFLMVLIACPIFLVNYQSKNLFNLLDIIGILLFAFGFYFEATADKQLANFKKNPKNTSEILQTGLWKYCRHPNYFGEVVIWWGIFFMALASGWFLPAIISPLLITFLILKISGIPMLENKYRNNPKYKTYVKSTNAFFPKFKF